MIYHFHTATQVNTLNDHLCQSKDSILKANTETFFNQLNITEAFDIKQNNEWMNKVHVENLKKELVSASMRLSILNDKAKIWCELTNKRRPSQRQENSLKIKKEFSSFREQFKKKKINAMQDIGIEKLQFYLKLNTWSPNLHEAWFETRFGHQI